MDDLYSRNHEVTRRARELIDQVAERIACSAFEDARPFDRPDALEAWRTEMPSKQKAERMSDEQMIAMLVRREIARAQPVTKADMHAYVERRLQCLAGMIGDEIGIAHKKELAALRSELETLRADLARARGPALVQPERTIGHAVNA
jgi:hypothetical protein